MTLFRQFFSAHLKGLLIWIAVAVLMALSGTRSAAMFMNTNMWETLPQSVMSMYGNVAGLSPVDIYLTLIIGKGTVLIPTLYAVLMALSIVTREVDRRTVEFLLALPVQRTQVLTARIAVLVVNVTLVAGSIWAVQRFDMAAQGFQGDWGHHGLVFINLWLLSLALGAVTLAASMWIDDYSVGVKLCLGIVVLGFILSMVMRAAGVSGAVSAISPFSYLDIGGVMRSGRIATGDAITLAVALAAGLAVSFWAFNRKQFSA
ncbi:MAG TPA: ABC transporter permease subunit [Symbiobacteriaceae bacterium]|jgi:ABC-2 type transport system permease protein